MRLIRDARPSARLRLTLIYAGLFLLAGGMLLTFNYLLMQNRLQHKTPEGHARSEAPGEASLDEPDHLRPILEETSREIRAEALRQLLIQSGIALAVMAAVSAGLGWLMAGRVLRPLHQITATAHRMSESSLHERIALHGPEDELKELADTFDGMLARLDAAFESQKRFVANASHELRTPLAIIRTELDVTLDNRDVTSAELNKMAQVVRGAIDRSERLIDGLLVLARSESGLPERLPVDLADIAGHIATESQPAAQTAGVEIRTQLEPAPVTGDPVLLERLAQNLLDNAIRYNLLEHGEITVTTDKVDGGVHFTVENTGPPVPEYEVPNLFEPFRRLPATERLADSTTSPTNRGAGLGLSIVRSVARAHGGDVHASPREDGGLTIRVRIPAVSVANL